MGGLRKDLAHASERSPTTRGALVALALSNLAIGALSTCFWGFRRTMTGKSSEEPKAGLTDAVSKLAAMDSEQLLQTMKQKENSKAPTAEAAATGKRTARKRNKSQKAAEAEETEAEFLAQEPPVKKPAKAAPLFTAASPGNEAETSVPSLFKPSDPGAAPVDEVGSAQVGDAGKDTTELPAAQNLTASASIPPPQDDQVPAIPPADGEEVKPAVADGAEGGDGAGPSKPKKEKVRHSFLDT